MRVQKTLNNISLFDAAEKDLLRKEARAALARKVFYYFCREMMPEVYVEGRSFLREYCDLLQAMYERRVYSLIYKDDTKTDWIIAKSVDKIPVVSKTGKGKIKDVIICRRVMINMPPQHWKSRTLTLFCSWILGVNNNEHILSVSYNQDVANTFSKYTRDTIDSGRKLSEDIVYRDLFPDVGLNPKDKSAEFWCINNSYFSYAAAGMGGSITSKGPTVRIVDDPIKGNIEAENANELEKQYGWFLRTFSSRKDAGAGEPLTIINMTRWNDNDLCGRILASPVAHLWYNVKFPAYNANTGKMLCEDALSLREYLDKVNECASDYDMVTLEANYNQNIMVGTNMVYSRPFLTYKTVPEGTVCCKVDVADKGDDYLCAIWYVKTYGDSGGNIPFAYIIDVLYTKQPQRETEGKLCDMIMRHGTVYADFEGNRDGDAFMRLVERNLAGRGWVRTVFNSFDTTKRDGSKDSRIKNNASTVLKQIIFPEDAYKRWTKFYKDVKSYSNVGKNRNDDGPDTLTFIAMDLDVGRSNDVYDVYYA